MGFTALHFGNVKRLRRFLHSVPLAFYYCQQGGSCWPASTKKKKQSIRRSILWLIGVVSSNQPQAYLFSNSSKNSASLFLELVPDDIQAKRFRLLQCSAAEALFSDQRETETSVIFSELLQQPRLAHVEVVLCECATHEEKLQALLKQNSFNLVARKQWYCFTLSEYDAFATQNSEFLQGHNENLDKGIDLAQQPQWREAIWSDEARLQDLYWQCLPVALRPWLASPRNVFTLNPVKNWKLKQDGCFTKRWLKQDEAKRPIDASFQIKTTDFRHFELSILASPYQPERFWECLALAIGQIKKASSYAKISLEVLHCAQGSNRLMGSIKLPYGPEHVVLVKDNRILSKQGKTVPVVKKEVGHGQVSPA